MAGSVVVVVVVVVEVVVDVGASVVDASVASPPPSSEHAATTTPAALARNTRRDTTGFGNSLIAGQSARWRWRSRNSCQDSFQVGALGECDWVVDRVTRSAQFLERSTCAGRGVRDREVEFVGGNATAARRE